MRVVPRIFWEKEPGLDLWHALPPETVQLQRFRGTRTGRMMEFLFGALAVTVGLLYGLVPHPVRKTLHYEVGVINTGEVRTETARVWVFKWLFWAIVFDSKKRGMCPCDACKMRVGYR